MTDLPESWAHRTLGEVATRVTKGTTPTTNGFEFVDQGINFIKIENLSNGRIDARSLRQFISEQAHQAQARSILEENDILFSIAGTIGATAIVEARHLPANTNQALAILSGFAPVLLPKLLKMQLESLVARETIARARGGAMNNISLGDLREAVVTIPPLPEQHRIVAKIEALFSELDKAVESLTLARAQLKTYRTALLKHAFEGKLTADWRAANADKLETPEALLSRIHREREARYARASDAWQTALAEWRAGGEMGRKPSRPARPSDIRANPVPVANVLAGWVRVPMGLMVDEPAYGTSKKCAYDIAGTGVLRIPNIARGRIDARDLKFAAFDDDERQTYQLQVGDLLTIRSNGSPSLVGKTALIDEAHKDFLYAGYLIRLRPNPRVINPHYLLKVLESHDLRSQIEAAAKSTSGVNNVNSGELQELTIPVCTLEEQTLIVQVLEERLSVLEAEETEIDTALAKANALRQSILKQAFSGLLVAQDPADEPASALLARLRGTAPVPKTRRKKTA